MAATMGVEERSQVALRLRALMAALVAVLVVLHVAISHDFSKQCLLIYISTGFCSPPPTGQPCTLSMKP